MVEPIKDASHLYEVERRDVHAQREGFRISELQISPSQSVPWHYHSNIKDTFYVLSGEIAIHLMNPKEVIALSESDSYTVAPRRPHLVRNPGPGSATFLILQGIGDYDYVPIT